MRRYLNGCKLSVSSGFVLVANDSKNRQRRGSQNRELVIYRCWRDFHVRDGECLPNRNGSSMVLTNDNGGVLVHGCDFGPDVWLHADQRIGRDG